MCMLHCTGLCQAAARDRVVAEASKLDEYGVCNFIVKNSVGHLVRVGIGGRSVSVNNLSVPENPQRYACMCTRVYKCMDMHSACM